VSAPTPHRLAAVRVLVEGRSDAVVVAHLLRTHGLPLARVEVMDGVTNIERELTRLASTAPGAEVCGLYDAAEERFVRRALARRGIRADGHTDLARAGFFACDADLEDELIRALGTDVVEEAVTELGELPRLRTFQRQPEWRGRPPAAQLRRFAGAGSGRKERLAADLAGRLTPATTPAPLARLVRYVAVSVTIDGCTDDPAAR
jgi:hypothetical protein